MVNSNTTRTLHSSTGHSHILASLTILWATCEVRYFVQTVYFMCIARLMLESLSGDADSDTYCTSFMAASTSAMIAHSSIVLTCRCLPSEQGKLEWPWSYESSLSGSGPFLYVQQSASVMTCIWCLIVLSWDFIAKSILQYPVRYTSPAVLTFIWSKFVLLNMMLEYIFDKSFSQI